jgi:hypothetical protein
LPGGRIGTSYSHSYFSGNSFDLEINPVLHNIQSPSTGYSREAQIELLSTTLRYEANSKQFFIQKLDLVNIISIPSLNPPLYPIAWNLKLGMEQDYDCDKTGYNSSCVRYSLSGGTGASVLWEPIQLYFFPQVDFAYQNENAFEVSAGTFSGFTFKTTESSMFSSRIDWMKRYSVLYHSWRDHLLSDSSFSFQPFFNFESKIFYKYNFINYDWQAGFGFYWHFF